MTAWRARVAAVALATVTMVGVSGFATSAVAATCPDGWCGLWGIAEGVGGVNVRTGPSLSAKVNGQLNNQDPVEVICYTTGTPVNGDPYWDQVTDTNPDDGVAGFAADTFIYTGGDVNTQTHHC